MPKRRFPEFQDAKAWSEQVLGDFADKSVRWSFAGGPFGSNLKSSDYTSSGVRIIQLQNIGDGEFLNEYKIYTSLPKAEELLSNNIYPGEILLSKMGDPVGRACLVPDFHDRYVMCSDGIRLSVDEQRHSKYFAFSLINAPQIRSLIERSATGSTRKRIGIDELRGLSVPIAGRAEQQKIADCLSSLDALIAAESQRLVALCDYKKGLMQQLFPRPERIENGEKIPAETIPRLRFPDFKDAGEWEWKNVDAIAEIFKGKGISKADIVTDGQRPCIRYGELYTSYGEVIDEVASRTNVPKRDLFMSRANDVIIPSSGETKVDIATAACVLHEDIALGGDLNVIRSAHNGIFLSYFFNGPLKYSIAKVAQGDSVVHLYPSQIGTLNIAIPSADEQKRIADTMFAVERALVERQHQIVALKAHKSGLMQQLFPSPVERGA